MAISNLMISAESFPEGIVVSDFSGCFWQPVKAKDKSRVISESYFIVIRSSIITKSKFSYIEK